MEETFNTASDSVEPSVYADEAYALFHIIETGPPPRSSPDWNARVDKCKLEFHAAQAIAHTSPDATDYVSFAQLTEQGWTPDAIAAFALREISDFIQPASAESLQWIEEALTQNADARKLADRAHEILAALPDNGRINTAQKNLELAIGTIEHWTLNQEHRAGQILETGAGGSDRHSLSYVA